MNSAKIKLDHGEGIQWPNKCAMCGEVATHSASSSFTTLKNVGFYVVLVTLKHQTYSMLYPVCRKHRFLCNILDHPARESFVSLSFFVAITTALLLGFSSILLTFAFDYFGLTFMSKIYEENGWKILGAAYFVASILYVSGIFKPVTISNVKDDSLVVSIKNKKFFNEFTSINSERIIGG